jgi:hypothetical protein
LCLALREAQPTQTIEKIVHVVAGRDALVRINKRLICHAIGKHVLWDK